MAIILSIETSTEACSVALHVNSKLAAYFEIQISKSHSGALTNLIDQTVRFSRMDLKEIDAIAISKGPGSYTGLRVGTSTAKGLAMALDKPLIAVNTLKSMAFEVNKSNFHNVLLCPMLDARRMEVYCSIFNSDMKELVDTNALILDETSFAELLLENLIIFFGNGSGKFKNIINNPRALFLDEVVPKAKNIGELASESFVRGEFENLHSFEPFYLKDFVMRKN